MNWIRLPVLAACIAGLAASAGGARADDLAAIEGLARSGQKAEALARVDQALAERPRDAQLRLTKAILLADAGRESEAIEVLVALNQDYPELAEPYNNLAVLHAARGDYGLARLALESAVRANPAYALAWRNLGDVYLRLAAQAYRRTLALDPAAAALGARIAEIERLAADRPVASRVAPR